MVPTQPLLALGFSPPPLRAAAASHPHFRLLRPEIPELAHPPGPDVTAAPCRAAPLKDRPRKTTRHTSGLPTCPPFQILKIGKEEQGFEPQ
ncbi:unnamed protein product [Nyctereutes procyonoides]|uniref:(raccoon dog) hypothetical protein n=1 Tax=Nyctereutes procyonoides TaxID=34880 RepID=A0A811YEU1_NYCPR|nr:unnamed protein product [Nyctereutes procyonoides]